MSEPKATKGKLSDFRPLQDNPNLHTQRGLRLLEESVQEDGWVAPITVAADGESLDGAARLEVAYDKMGEEAIVIEHDGTKPVIMVRTDVEDAKCEKGRRIIWRANRIAEVDLNFDLDLLLADAEIIPPGLWTDIELEAILGEAFVAEDKEAPEAQMDRAAELQEIWQVENGQIWEIPSKTVEGQMHWVMCGDANEGSEKLLDGQRPSLLLTDPPYGVSIVTGLRATVGGSKPVTIGSVRGRRPYPFGGVKNVRGTDGAANMVDATLYRPVHGDDEPFDPIPLLPIGDDAIIWGGNYFASKLPDSRCWIVWDKENTGNFADAELAWTSFDRPIKLYKFKWSGLVREGKRDIEGLHRVHPTQKPVGLFVDILQDFSDEGALISDLYLGSGTTMLACELCGRISRCMEIVPDYVAVTLDRAKRMGLEPKLLQ